MDEFDEEVEDPRTDTERWRDQAQQLRRKAQNAQDRLGWADWNNHEEVTCATVDLARIVTELSQLVHQTLVELVNGEPRAEAASDAR
jgi:hypothetical protein